MSKKFDKDMLADFMSNGGTGFSLVVCDKEYKINFQLVVLQTDHGCKLVNLDWNQISAEELMKDKYEVIGVFEEKSFAVVKEKFSNIKELLELNLIDEYLDQ